jgi:hypothetical protein
MIYQWDEWDIAVFYQNTSDEIRCHQHANKGWFDNGFLQPDAHKGQIFRLPMAC